MTEQCTQIIHKALRVVEPQFRLDFRGGVHGVPHWSRVWIHGRDLAEELGVNPCILAWFAFLHDSQRFNDDVDLDHGGRAADFAVGLRRERVITELDDSEFEFLCEAMRLHSDGHTVGEVAILACWDADRLDLGRVGIRPHPARLCTEPGKQARRIDAAVWMSTATNKSLKVSRRAAQVPGRKS